MERAPMTVAGTDTESLPLPRAFGNYLLFDRIGAGGMAEIFLGRATNEFGGARRLVVKEILPRFSNDAGFASMLIREAKLAAQLTHRNVVQVIDLGRESGRLFICMEYVEGYDLNQLLRRLSKARLPLPAEFALLIIRETLTALDYAHRAHDATGAPFAIVHRDVSPSNVLISFDGEVKLCDFGIARALASEPGEGGDDASAPMQRSRLAGKSAYMAPEHARGEEIDSRADIFAAGILLWELCAGRRLYKGTEAEMLEMAREARVPLLPDRGLPNQAQLQAIFDRALTRDPGSRFQSAAEMLEALDDYIFAARLMGSELHFGAFLTENFADEIVQLRRSREQAAQKALDTTGITATEVDSATVPSEFPRVESKIRPRGSGAPEARSSVLATVALGALVISVVATAATALALWLL